MSRSALNAGNRAETSKPAVRIAEFAQFDFPGGAIRIATAPSDVQWNGHIWKSQGSLEDYEGLEEHTELKGRRTSFRLSALDETLLTRIFNDNFHYSAVKVWLGFFDENWKLVAEPYQLTDELLMSSATLSIESGEGQVELSAETWDLFGQRDAAVLVTPESQRLRYTGDTGMDKVAHIMTIDIEWGGSSDRIGDTYSRGPSAGEERSSGGVTYGPLGPMWSSH